MIQDYLIILLIFGILLYFDNVSKYAIGIIIIYIIFTLYKQYKSDIYDKVNDTVKPDRLSEYIERNDEIIDISKYKHYDKRSYLNGLKKFKKINKYLDRLNNDNNVKINKNIIQNCYYYLDESVNNFKAISNSIDIENIDDYLDKVNKYKEIMKKKIDDKKYDYGMMYEYDSL